MKHITTWSPDTCGCELHYEWDDAIPEAERVHTPVEEFIDSAGNIRRSKKCDHHKLLATKEEHHTKILAENQGKNKVLGLIAEFDDGYITEEKQNTDGTSYKVFKQGLEPSWAFDETRKLQVGFKTGGKLKAGRQTLFSTALTQKLSTKEIDIEVEVK